MYPAWTVRACSTASGPQSLCRATSNAGLAGTEGAGHRFMYHRRAVSELNTGAACVPMDLVRTGPPRRRAGRVDVFSSRERSRLAHGLLVAVSVAYLVVIMVRTSQSMGPTWDEVIYLSQVVRDVPAAAFSAPRSRGMPWMLAPVAAFTSEMFPIRVYIGLVSGLLMYLAFRPWLAMLQAKRTISIFVSPLAAGLFATLWMTLLYGTMGYPNLWLGFVLTSAIGYYCLAMQQGHASLPIAAAITTAFAVASLLRPVDALAAASPLLLASVIIRDWRLPVPAAGVIGGLATGWGAWIAEAFVRFDGPLQRLRQGAEVNEGGVTWSLPKYLESLDGPYLLCRPPDLCAGVSIESSLWWLALPLLTVIGILASRRDGWLKPASIAVCCALSIALPYFLLFDYAAPRFLLPTYALLALPAAAALLWIAMRSTWPVRVIAAAAVAAAIVGHGWIQMTILEDAHAVVVQAASKHSAQASYIQDEYGIEAPCLIVGEGAIQQSYLLGCQSLYAPSAAVGDQRAAIMEALEQGHDVVVRMRAADTPPAFIAQWQHIALPHTDNHVAYIRISKSAVTDL